ncbi:hypothetical protein [Cryptosporangium sp. NPDC051539]|uniref:hypothetical protein n=1 Tax=Cryptosporangium sp. NPDC051539 TaxID=3363962 RepID=UPI003795E824
MIGEKALSDALHDLADADAAGVAPVAGLLRRGHRARRGRHARAALVTTAVAGLVATLTVASRPMSDGLRPVPLALAAQTTARTSFHLSVEMTVGDDPADPVVKIPAEQGKYDPVHDRGYLRSQPIGPKGLVSEKRQIGKDCYEVITPGHWFPSQACWMFGKSPQTAGLGVSASPRELLAELRQAGKVTYTGRTGEGGRALDTYRFSYQNISHTDSRTTAGTVEIDVATRRIVKVSYQVSEPVRNAHQPARILPTNVVIRLDDFGTPVDVQAPPGMVQRPAVTPS